GKSGSRSRSPVASASAPGESARGESARDGSAFMTGTLAVTAGRGEAGPGRAGARPNGRPRVRGSLEGFIPARLTRLCPVSDSIGIYPRQKYAGRRHKGSAAIAAVIAMGRGSVPRIHTA